MTTPLGEDIGMKIRLVFEDRELVRWRWTAKKITVESLTGNAR
jgi:hypothetical protein